MADTIHSLDSGRPKPPAAAAYYGLAGEFVRAIEPHTEADPCALLVQLLVGFGNVIGRGPYFVAEGARHYTNLFVVLVGETSKGRKGSSWARVREVLDGVDPGWATRCLASGLASGEGLIWAVRDPVERTERVREGKETKYESVQADPGVEDKRLLCYEAELASVLRVLARDGNTLSALIRNAWDTGELRTLTKNSPARATGAHVSIVGHSTKDEVVRYLDRTEAGNGFGNRFLWVWVERSKSLPDGGQVPPEAIERIARALRDACEFARGVQEMKRDDAARALWHRIYTALSEGKPGLFGAMIARAEAQVMRLACLFALLDRSAVVRVEHLKAALFLWRYCEGSVRHVFGEALGDPVADEILGSLRKSPDGLTRTQIRDLFGRHRTGDVDRALRMLLRHGLAFPESHPTEGRPVEVWIATKASEATEDPGASEGADPLVASVASVAGAAPAGDWGQV